MTPIRVTLGIFGVTLVMGGFGYWAALASPATPSARAGSAATTAVFAPIVTIEAIPAPRPPAPRRPSPRVDLYGNEVEEAVSDYRFDRRGDTYERHSPDTEVARLSPAHS